LLRAFAPLLALVLTACAAKSSPPPAAPPPLACAGAETLMAEFQLLLGRNIPAGGQVSRAAFSEFVAKTVAPAFPAGFTVIDAEGHYLPQNAKDPIREPSKLIVIVAPDTLETGARITAIASAYKTRFAQESVAIIRRPACASF
jgi:hypothetical protein